MANRKSTTPRRPDNSPKIVMEVTKASKSVAVKLVSKTANAENTKKFITEAIDAAVKDYGAKAFRGTIVAYK